MVSSLMILTRHRGFDLGLDKTALMFRHVDYVVAQNHIGIVFVA